MNKHVKNFFLRGLLFGGFGPIIAGVVYAILSFTIEDFSLGGVQVCVAIVSTYILAFLQAGASVFNQIEDWPVPKSLLCHFLTIYVAYTGCYLINSWIPFVWEVLLIFTGIFVVTYFVIWFIVYFSVKATCKKFNTKLS